MTDPYHPTTETLSAEECWRLFATRPTGRIAAVMAGRIELFPVNLAALEGNVYIRTAPGTLLSTVVASSEVVVEMDGADDIDGTEHAWSVIVRGGTEMVSAETLEAELEAKGPHPWQEGVKDDFVKVVPTEVSGRRFPVTHLERDTV